MAAEVTEDAVTVVAEIVMAPLPKRAKDEMAARTVIALFRGVHAKEAEAAVS